MATGGVLLIVRGARRFDAAPDIAGSDAQVLRGLSSERAFFVHGPSTLALFQWPRADRAGIHAGRTQHARSPTGGNAHELILTTLYKTNMQPAHTCTIKICSIIDPCSCMGINASVLRANACLSSGGSADEFM